jgi:acyl transferase domain-containing protein
VLGRGRPENLTLLIGAIKSNLGHLEAAAGIAGFIKAVLAVQRGENPAEPALRGPKSTHSISGSATESSCRTD